MTDYGFKVSQEGYDVKTATDTQLVFSTKFGAFPPMSIVASGSVEATGTDPITITVDHDLGYVPFVLVFFNNEDEPNKWQSVFSSQLADIVSPNFPTATFLDVYPDRFIQKFVVDTGEKTVTIKYYIFNAGISV